MKKRYTKIKTTGCLLLIASVGACTSTQNLPPNNAETIKQSFYQESPLRGEDYVQLVDKCYGSKTLSSDACTLYNTGVLTGINAIATMVNLDKPFCLPPNLSDEILTKTLSQHISTIQNLQKLPSAVSLLIASSDLYPCPLKDSTQ